ncbi:Ig-like domain-containing protein [Rheinheimera sp. A13L]|uniref:Ig-like domain-containing protein n=1 Tax=Rheinheimera sp. A13L TaxID=506534 RepID=UPI0002124A46|nr:Ig-like domain-containing protein [Rheinheimera sp. A13L]EGM78318.1 Ig-like domain-containing protein [Rheinheimera sp. A13L]
MVGNQKMQLNICYRWLLSLLVLLFIAGCNSDKDPILGLEPVDGLQSILISPENPTLAAGLTQQFTVLGVYANGTSLDISDKVIWSSATVAVSTINSQGLATALQPGTSVIAASFAGKSANTQLTVTSAVLTSISISPLDASVADGLTTQFIATGVYSDGTTENISSVVNWLSSDTSIAVMNPSQTASSGLATAVAPGNTEISATLGALSASTRLTVTDAILMSIQLTPVNANLFVGVSRQFSATGVYSDGTSQDISALVSWDSSAQATATIDSTSGANHGLASGLAAGATQISATLGTVSAETTLTVNAATLSSIVVTPLISTVTTGLSRQFVATANYADGSSFDVSRSVVWASADTQIATMNANGAVNSGLATGQAAGTVQITATLGLVSGSASLTVNSATLTSLVITPALSSVVAGQNRQFTATGVYSDGSSEDLTSLVTWSSSDNAIALPNANMQSNSGLVAGLSSGTVQIRATQAAVSAEATLIVTAATLSSISVTPVISSVAMGLNRQFVATGIYSDGSTLTISQSVVWASANTQTATMNANGNSASGLATGQAAGVVQISATLGSISGAATLTVTNASLSSISVTPVNPSVVDGLTRQFNATGTYSDGSTADLTAVANWTSGTIAVASMNASLAANSGLATGLSAGTSLIRASFAGLDGSTTLTVTAAALTAIEVTPENASAVVNETERFTATGVYTDGSRINISSTVVWTSSNVGVAVMNANGQLNSGLATAMAAGISTITATLGTTQDSAVLTVTAALANNPQAPAMGELQRFVMIASQAITTTAGSAVADGDMAILDLARTAYAGFTPGPVAGQFTQLTNGVSYAPDDVTPPYVVPVPYASMVAFINQVRTDLGVAATFLAADPNPAAATQALPAELGGRVMTRGVYRTAGNVIIQQGNLTLDAQGDPDSVFIFVITGTFTTGAPGGNIVLTGGAQARNVFWRTGGVTVFGSNTSFAGNVFAWQQINLGTGTAITGRLFSVTEQVTLDANAVTKPQ